jgi:multidrug resistance efflux pump
MNRRAAAAAAVALALVLGAWRLTGGNGGSGSRAVAKRADLVIDVGITGTLRALDSDQAGPPVLPDIWEYRLVKMATEGASVKKGQMVLQFDTTELAQKLEEKKAERDSAGKQLEKRGLELAVREEGLALQEAEAEARRRKAELKVEVPAELVGANELAQSRLDLGLARRELEWVAQRRDAARRAADAERSSLKERFERASARVRELEDRIRQMTVPAPRDGTLIYLPNWRDEKKKVGDVCWRGERVVEVPDLGRMIVKGEVDEADSAMLAEGQRVSLRLEAHPDAEFAGRVLSVGRTVQRQNPRIPKKIVKVDVALDASDPLRMRPGMRVRGEIETGRHPGLLVLPLEAVFPSPAGPVAWRPAWRGVSAVSLTLGRRNQKVVEIVKGLEEGASVLAGPPPGGAGRGSP